MDARQLTAIVNAIRAEDEAEMAPGIARMVAAAIGSDDATLSFIGGHDKRIILTASSPRARCLDEWQFGLEEGPCLVAASSGHVAIAPTADPVATPWPRLAAKAFQMGFTALAGVPMGLGDVRFGAINLQWRSRFAVDPAVLDEAVQLAGAISPSVADHLAEATPPFVEEWGYDVVQQAAELVAGHLDTSLDDALATLRARAWAEDRGVADIAAEVVDRGLRFTPLASS